LEDVEHCAVVRQYREAPATDRHVKVQAELRRVVGLAARPLLLLGAASKEAPLERCQRRVPLLILAAFQISTHHAHWLGTPEATARGRRPRG
jgi:hypothetical protein